MMTLQMGGGPSSMFSAVDTISCPEIEILPFLRETSASMVVDGHRPPPRVR